MMKYLTVIQAAEKKGISTRRVRLLCANGEIGRFFVHKLHKFDIY